MEVKEKHFTDEFADFINSDDLLTEADKAQVLRNLAKLKHTKVNILITGATGCGKSSTINALFNAERAVVGQGVAPETMDISKYEMQNIAIFDSPGLGDGKEADQRHSENIIDKLYEKDSNGEMLVDLVLVILDGSSKDLGTSFELINQVIIPNLGDDKSRLVVAINQADMAMKGRNWNYKTNQPEDKLIEFLNDKVTSTQRRIKEATGVDVKPVFYAAGYKDGGDVQNPYNLSKLLAFILRHTRPEKRAVYAQDLNSDKEMWEDDDQLEDYRKEIQETLWESVKTTASEGSSIGADIGKALGGRAGETVGRFAGAIVGGAVGAVKSFFKSWG